MFKVTYTTGHVPNLPWWKAMSMSDEEIRAYNEQFLKRETVEFEEGRMTDKLQHYPRIYCSNCQAIQTLATDEMPADHLNDHAAMDLMCGECRLVIATVHALPSEGGEG